MLTFFTIVHVILCVFMIFVILLQPGKDAGMGAALGGGAATSAFGGRGAVTFLSKLTGVCAALFFLTSLGLSFVGLKGSVAADDSSVAAPAPTTPPIQGGATDPTVPPAAPAAQGAQSAPSGNSNAPAGAPTGAPAGSVEQPRGAAPAAPAPGNQAAPAAPAPAPAQ
jgi:preprotein translocase subunit SecG